jgi:acyl transferase domain-containing protein
VAARIEAALSRDDDAILDAHGSARPAVAALSPRGAWVAVESEGHDPFRRVLRSAGRLYAAGAAIRWPAVYPDGGRRVSAPSYPWQRRRYWLGDLVAKRARRPAPHPLVGPAQTIAGQPHLVIFESTLKGSRLEELAGHAADAERDAPPGALVEMAAASARQRLGSTLVTLEDLVIERPLHLGACETAQVVTDKREPDRVNVQVASLDGRTNEWTTHASCRARAGTTLAGVHQTPGAVIGRCGSPTAGAIYYAALTRRGWRGALAPIETVWQSEGEAIARLKLPDEVDVDTFLYLVHPALFEACVHAGIGLGPEVGSACASVQRIERTSIHARLDTGTALYVHVQRRDQGTGRVVVDAAVVDEAGRAIVEVMGLAISLADAPQGRLDDGADHSASASAGE